MVDNMEMRHIVKEEPALPPQEVSVNSSGCSTLEVPFFAAVVGQDRVRMVQVGDHDNYCLRQETRSRKRC
jgi:hypothetical protein